MRVVTENSEYNGLACMVQLLKLYAKVLNLYEYRFQFYVVPPYLICLDLFDWLDSIHIHAVS